MNMQSLKHKLEVVNELNPTIDDGDWLFYVATPYSYNPEEAIRYARYYRNQLVSLGIYSYNPICETHNAHQEYMRNLASNWSEDSVENEDVKQFNEKLYRFYVDEDLLKAEMMYKGSSHTRKFALLLGIGWNLKFPINEPFPKNQTLFDLYEKYRNYSDTMVHTISLGVLKEYFWAMQHGVPVYGMGALLGNLSLKQVQMEIVEDQTQFFKDAQRMGLQIK